MYALILYAIFVIIGTVIAGAIGLAFERYLHDGLDVLVFIGLFFLNFYVSWMLTRMIVERLFKPDAGEPQQTTPSA